jgi:hypothetical protein
VLTLGREPWCSSNWHDIYYRVFRLDSTPQSRAIIEGGDSGFVAAPIEGRITSSDALIRYSIGSLMPGFQRTVVKHYSVHQDKVQRIDPVALSPRDFDHPSQSYEHRAL